MVWASEAASAVEVVIEVEEAVVALQEEQQAETVTQWEVSHRNTTIISEAPVIELYGVSYDCLEVSKNTNTT